MKKIDIYEDLNKEGFNVSYSSVINAVNKKERKKKEAYIKREYVQVMQLNLILEQ